MRSTRVLFFDVKGINVFHSHKGVINLSRYHCPQTEKVSPQPELWLIMMSMSRDGNGEIYFLFTSEIHEENRKLVAGL